MRKFLIASIVTNLFLISQITLSQTIGSVCTRVLGVDKSCTHHIHDTNLNLPSFVTDYLVQSAVHLIIDCDNNIKRNRCSAVLLNNNTNANDNEVLILTARHCLHEDFVEGSVFDLNMGLGQIVNLSNSAIVFNVSKPNPNNTYNPESFDKFYVNASIELIAESVVGDIALLKANVDIPPHFNVYYAGWTAESQIDISSNEKHYNISHPSNGTKKVVTLRENTLESFQVGWLKSLTFEEGVIYPGSSGSPVYNEEFKVYGALSGGVNLGGCNSDSNGQKNNVNFGSLRFLFFLSSDVRNALNNNNNFGIIAMGGNRINCYRNNLTDLKGNYWPHNIYQPNNYIEIKAENKIISSSTEALIIKSGSEYSFMAGEEIVFSGEVTIEQGAEFTAKIQPCMPNMINPNQDDGQEVVYMSELDKLIIQTLEERGLTLEVLDNAYLDYVTKKDTLRFIKLADEVNSILNMNNEQYLNLSSINKLLLYPNPNTGQFTIVVQTLNEHEQLQLSVMDVYGKQIFNQQIANSENHPIDLSAYSKGIYYVSVTGNSGFREVKKVVVN